MWGWRSRRISINVSVPKITATVIAAVATFHRSPVRQVDIVIDEMFCIIIIIVGSIVTGRVTPRPFQKTIRVHSIFHNQHRNILIVAYTFQTN